MAYTTVFVVSDNSAIRDSLSKLIGSAGLRAETFPSLEMWLAVDQPERRGCLVLDARARDFICPDCRAKFACMCATRPVLLLIDRGDVPIAVRAIRDGALDVFEKPYRDESLLERIKHAAAAAEVAETDRGST
jgi:FixJ family two-component response regulator